jgi:3-oxoacyl-ACP reductase-like protein
MTAGDVITRLREQIQDEVKPYRWSDTLLLAYLSGTLQEMSRRRPDLAAALDWSQNAVSDVTSLTDILVYDESTRDGLVYGTAERVYLTEEPDQGNVRQAQIMRQKFESEIF